MSQGCFPLIQVGYQVSKMSDSEHSEHLLGAAGYSRDLPLEKYYRDAKAQTVLEGASEIQRHIIAGEL